MLVQKNSDQTIFTMLGYFLGLEVQQIYHFESWMGFKTRYRFCSLLNYHLCNTHGRYTCNSQVVWYIREKEIPITRQLQEKILFKINARKRKKILVICGATDTCLNQKKLHLRYVTNFVQLPYTYYKIFSSFEHRAKKGLEIQYHNSYHKIIFFQMEREEKISNTLILSFGANYLIIQNYKVFICIKYSKF